jgi:hypothetical protein
MLSTPFNSTSTKGRYCVGDGTLPEQVSAPSGICCGLALTQAAGKGVVGHDVHRAGRARRANVRTSVKLSREPLAVCVLVAAGRQRSCVEWLWLCAQVRAAGRTTAAQCMHAVTTG